VDSLELCLVLDETPHNITCVALSRQRAVLVIQLAAFIVLDYSTWIHEVWTPLWEGQLVTMGDECNLKEPFNITRFSTP
jgi:hypothetical protein